MDTMKALKIITPHNLEIVQIEIPEPKENEILIKVMSSGICGTDLHILDGEYLGEYPIIPGHEFSGTVIKAGDKVKRIKVGDKVAVEPNIPCDNCSYCLSNQQNFCENWTATGVSLPGGMSQYVVAPEKAAFNIGNLSFDEGAFVEPLSCVLHGVGKVAPKMADKVLIVGCGPIGMLLIQAVKNCGVTNITVVEPDSIRNAEAVRLGADKTETSLDKVQKDGYDIVIDATGILPLMSKSLEFVKRGGKILLFGVPPKKNVEFDAFTMFLKGVSIMTSYTSLRNSFQAVSLLETGKIDVKPLISHRLPLEDFQRAVEIIKGKKENVLKIIINPN